MDPSTCSALHVNSVWPTLAKKQRDKGALTMTCVRLRSASDPRIQRRIISRRFAPSSRASPVGTRVECKYQGRCYQKGRSWRNALPFEPDFEPDYFAPYRVDKVGLVSSDDEGLIYARGPRPHHPGRCLERRQRRLRRPLRLPRRIRRPGWRRRRTTTTPPCRHQNF